MRIYLDIETYRPVKEESFTNEKIVVIGVIEDWTPYRSSSSNIWDSSSVKTLFFKEWELGSEKNVLASFYGYLRNLINRWNNNEINFINVVGFNILRYDIPFLIQKGVEYGVGSLEELNALWHNTFTIDYFQVFLPVNKMRFKGLGLRLLAELAKKKGLNVPEPHGTGEDVKEWYESKDYDNIIKHLESDLKIIRIIDLNYELLLKC
jgi:hypothetical protein